MRPLLLDVIEARAVARRRFEARQLAALARSWGRLLDRPFCGSRPRPSKPKAAL